MTDRPITDLTPDSIPDSTPESTPDLAAAPIDDTPVTRKVALKRSRPFSRGDLIVAGLLIVVIAFGAYFRLVGQNWDDFTHLHPDERFLTQVAEAVGTSGLNLQEPIETLRIEQLADCMARYPQTAGVGDFFDSRCSNWVPNNVGHGLYVYGELPLYVVKVSALIVRDITTRQAANTPDLVDDQLASLWTTYSGVHLVGRMVSAIADCLALFLTFLIGRRLYNKWVGLLAAAFYAAAVLPIQLSHFWTADAFTMFPLTLAFYFAVRTMDTGKWRDFLFFGVAFGMAIASRINVLPIIGVIGLAAIIHGLPWLDASVPRVERNRMILHLLIGLVITVIAALVVFRFAMPHAFRGGSGIAGIFNIVPYGPWLDDVRESQRLTSGAADSPPNHQWASRMPYGFAWWNMVAWGLGLPLGIAGWVGFGIGLVAVIRASPGWTRHALPVAWIAAYFLLIGRLWVAVMRYYVVMYPFLAILAAWFLYELVTRSYATLRARPRLLNRIAWVGATFALAFVLIGTLTWAGMFTSIYRKMLTRAEASVYVLRTFPAAFSTQITLPESGQTRLVNMRLWGSEPTITPVTPAIPLTANVQVPNDGRSIDRVVINRVRVDGGEPASIVLTITDSTESLLPLATGSATIQPDPDGAMLGSQVTLMLDRPFTPRTGTDANGLPLPLSYIIEVSTTAPITINRRGSDLFDFALQSDAIDVVASLSLPRLRTGVETQASVVLSDEPIQMDQEMPVDGTFDTIDVTHVISALPGEGGGTLRVEMLRGNATVIASGELNIDRTSAQNSVYGDRVSIKLDSPVTVTKGEKIYLSASVTSGTPLVATGTVIATEGPWDDPIPSKVCDFPLEQELTDTTPNGLFNAVTCGGEEGWGYYYKGLELYMAAEDGLEKINSMTSALDRADYVTMSSNRFYDSLSRIPLRFPMSIRYYDALWKGELGYDVVNTFTGFPRLGGFSIADQWLPTFSSPAWLNELESDESFSVYDHPTVYILKRDPTRYDPAKTLSILTAEPLQDNSLALPQGNPNTYLVNIIRWGAFESTKAPTGFMFSDQIRQVQQAGGTFSSLFNRNFLINQSPLLSIGLWWVGMLLIGFAAFPLIYRLLPGLADRGYPIAKVASLLIVSWIVFVGGTLRLPTWSSFGILVTLIGLLVVGLLLNRRSGIGQWIRLNWRHLAIVELITIGLYLGFVLIKTGNPDLWAQSLGGEKPMDFAYLNAVLKSSVFPAYDPWYANGYLNYYYYGFVLVGTPIKLMGILPEVAYNLLIPTLFAVTGMAAFSIAFNIVGARFFYRRDEGTTDIKAPVTARRRWALKAPEGSPYVAGVLAILLTVVVGNLDTPRVILDGVARQGGCSAPVTLETWKIDQAKRNNGGNELSIEELDAIAIAARSPNIGDQIGFGLYAMQYNLGCISNGLDSTIRSATLPLGPDRWFWAPTRIVSEVEGANNEINEFPYFTFLFGDLHAHMIALPITLLILNWILAEVLISGHNFNGTSRRATWQVIGSILFGALAVGLLRPTNTWDWITYLGVGTAGLIFAFFLRWKPLSRRKVATWGLQIALFVGASFAFAAPFMAFYATAYGSVKLFSGNKTQLWMYLDMHGLFLFILVAFLIWQTARFFRHTYVRDLIARRWIVAFTLIAVGFAALLTLIAYSFPLRTGVAVPGIPGEYLDAFVRPIPLALVAIPLLTWCVLLFLLPDQSREVCVILVMMGVGLAITMVVEVIVLDGDIGRQNTFFKFYMQIWLLFGVAAAVALTWLVRAAARWEGALRTTFLSITVVLLAVAGLFPIMATQGKNAMRMAVEAPRTINGLDYMEYAEYVTYYTYDGSVGVVNMGGDLKMIRWIQDNILGSPVILETAQYPSEYQFNSRIAINTGLPSVIGWNFHQQQQRTLDPLPNLIGQRRNNVYAMYNETDIPTVWRMLQFYHVKYIIVGKLERLTYQPTGLAKFAAMEEQGLLKRVYEGEPEAQYVPDDPSLEAPTAVPPSDPVRDVIYEVVAGVSPREGSVLSMAAE